MSYILDSLKKSDQERKRGSVPGLLSDHGQDNPEPGPPHRRRWPYLLGGGLLVANLVGLSVWLEPRQSAETVAEVPVPAAVPAAPEIAAPAAAGREARMGMNPEPDTDRPLTPTAAAGEVAPSPARSMVEEEGIEMQAPPGGDEQQGTGWRGPAATGGEGGQAGAEALAPGSESGRPAEGEDAETGAPTEEVAPPAGEGEAPPAELPPSGSPEEAFPAPEEAAPAAAPENGRPGTDEPAAVRPAPQTPPRQGAGSPAGAAGRQEPLALEQLPASVRSGLPEIHISAHFFSKNPSSRLVSVNGRILREGQEMDGLKVEEITPSGVVFIHRGRKFFMDVF